MFASRDVLGNGEGGATKWPAFGYTGRIPLKDVAPGRYLLRVEAQDRADADADAPFRSRGNRRHDRTGQHR